MHQTGALLRLKAPGHEHFLECEENIRQYMVEHIDSWYRYAKDRRGLRIERQDILFVSGFVKTSIWEDVVAFRYRSSSMNVDVGGALAPPGIPVLSASGRFIVSMSECRTPEVFHRSGPHGRLEDGADASAHDQCVFLQYISVKPRLFPFRLRAAGGPHQLPRSDSERFGDPLTISDSGWEVSDESNDTTSGAVSTFMPGLRIASDCASYPGRVSCR